MQVKALEQAAAQKQREAAKAADRARLREEVERRKGEQAKLKEQQEQSARRKEEQPAGKPTLAGSGATGEHAADRRATIGAARAKVEVALKQREQEQTIRQQQAAATAAAAAVVVQQRVQALAAVHKEKLGAAAAADGEHEHATGRVIMRPMRFTLLDPTAQSKQGEVERADAVPAGGQQLGQAQGDKGAAASAAGNLVSAGL